MAFTSLVYEEVLVKNLVWLLDSGPMDLTLPPSWCERGDLNPHGLSATGS